MEARSLRLQQSLVPLLLCRLQLSMTLRVLPSSFKATPDLNGEIQTSREHRRE
jgi:hypothetical protein